MHALYIVLQRKVPNVDDWVEGRALSVHADALEKLAKKMRVRPLMDFFRADENELSSLIDDPEILARTARKLPPDKWQSAEDGIRTIEALQKALKKSKHPDFDKLDAELDGFARVLRAAHEHAIGWHLGIDY